MLPILPIFNKIKTKFLITVYYVLNPKSKHENKFIACFQITNKAKNVYFV